jgi:hypothetical protein
MPVMADSMIYCRSREGTLLALDVASNRAPRVAAAAWATPTPVIGTSAALSVLGADDNGETNLVYAWSAVAPPAPVTFVPNSNNAAKSSTAAFTQAGNYNLAATIRDAGGMTATSSVSVVVTSTISSIAVSPAVTNVPLGGTQAFAATARDQFAQPLGSPPPFAWSVSGGGTMNASSVFTASATGGPFTVSASNGAVVGTAQVTVPADWKTNGIPDAWEVAYGMNPQNPTNAAADDDADGMNNAAEFVAGTNPTNKQSTTKLAIEITGNGVVVSYPTAQASGPGYAGFSRRAYDLQGSADLIGGQWTPIPGATNVPGSDTTAGYTNAGAEQIRFFRTRIRLE